MNTHSNPLLDRIRKRLFWDKRISMIDVKVDCLSSSGAIVISGIVDSVNKKEAALELVRNTDGVQSVLDNLAIESGMHRSDETLCSLIEAELQEVPWQRGEVVHVTVFGGVVKLTGTVYRKASKAMASGFCWELSGVRDCLNHILLADTPPVAEAQLRQLGLDLPEPARKRMQSDVLEFEDIPRQAM